MSGALASLSDQVQAVSDIYAANFGIDCDGDWALLKLQEELGELVQAHLKLTGRGRGGAAPEARADEAADVLCMLLLYCRQHGVDLEAAVDRKWLAYLKEPA